MSNSYTSSVRKSPSGPRAQGFPLQRKQLVAASTPTISTSSGTPVEIPGATLTLENLKAGQQIQAEVLGTYFTTGPAYGYFNLSVQFDEETPVVFANDNANYAPAEAVVYHDLVATGVISVPDGVTSARVYVNWSTSGGSLHIDTENNNSLALCVEVYSSGTIANPTLT